MKRLILAAALALVATAAYAACWTHTIVTSDGMLTCTTCCYGSGNCTTTCF